MLIKNCVFSWEILDKCVSSCFTLREEAWGVYRSMIHDINWLWFSEWDVESAATLKNTFEIDRLFHLVFN